MPATGMPATHCTGCLQVPSAKHSPLPCGPPSRRLASVMGLRGWQVSLHAGMCVWGGGNSLSQDAPASHTPKPLTHSVACSQHTHGASQCSARCPGAGLQALRKTLTGQLTLFPTYLCAFFTAMGLLEGRSPQQVQCGRDRHPPQRACTAWVWVPCGLAPSPLSAFRRTDRAVAWHGHLWGSLPQPLSQCLSRWLLVSAVPATLAR